MASKHICPKCGSTKFIATAHVTQSWEIDENGNFLSCTSNCDETTHAPDDNDIWNCANCGTEAIIAP